MMHTANPDHLALPPLIALNKRHDDRCSKVTKSRCYGTYNGDIAITREFWNLGVVFLEDTK